MRDACAACERALFVYRDVTSWIMSMRKAPYKTCWQKHASDTRLVGWPYLHMSINIVELWLLVHDDAHANCAFVS